jgi:hypothetical protein
MTHLVCFIDDSEFEHDLVRHEIAPLATGLEFCQAYTFEEARETLRNRSPVLFLLDLWGQDETVLDPHITPEEDLQKRIEQFPTLREVYEGMEHFEGDIHNEYLKRLFTIVNCWRNLFEDVCDAIGQNRKYGLANLAQTRKHYPGVPGVFYTRKSLISDAVAMFRAEADGLFIKPTGHNEKETRRLTRNYAPTLQSQLLQIIQSL